MFKYIRILVLLIIVVFSIYFEPISKYLSKEYFVKDIVYDNYKIKIPKKLNIDSIVYQNKLYLYGMYQSLNKQNSRENNEKRYIFSLKNGDWINLFITEEKFDIKDKDIDYIVNKEFNILNDVKLEESILKYKDIKFHIQKVNKLYLISIQKNNSKIIIMINKVRDKKLMNKQILELIKNISK